MIRLLMLDFDARLVSAVTRTLQQEGVNVIGVQSALLACQHVQSGSFDVALLDADLIEPAQFASFTRVPLVLLSSFLEPERRTRALPNARLLRKPFTTAELLSLLREAFGAFGSEPLGLVDELRLANTEGRTLTLRAGGGEIFVYNGELVHAEIGDATGESALAEILARANEPPIRVPVREVERTIVRPLQVVLLDLLHLIEERELKESVPPPAFKPPRGGTN